MNIERKLAKLILEVTPPIMHMVRSEVRCVAKSDLTVPQLRVLAHIGRDYGTIGELAELQGVAQPTMSKIVHGLVVRGYILKTKNDVDRRQQTLKLTDEGRQILNKVKNAASQKMAKQFEEHSDDEKKQLVSAFEIIQKIMLKNPKG